MDTPQTDAYEKSWTEREEPLFGLFELARQLERELASKEAQLREAERDARRYRWLFVDNGNGVLARVNGVYWGYYDGQPENWNAAIDAALASES